MTARATIFPAAGKWCFVRTGLLIAATLPAGCATHPVIDALPPPVDAGCADMCFVQCDASGITYAPGPDPIGNLVEQVIIPLRARLDQCELSRRACQQCIARLKAVGVVR